MAGESGRGLEATVIFDRLSSDAKKHLMRDGAAEVMGSYALTPQTSGALYFDKDGGVYRVLRSSSLIR